MITKVLYYLKELAKKQITMNYYKKLMAKKKKGSIKMQQIISIPDLNHVFLFLKEVILLSGKIQMKRTKNLVVQVYQIIKVVYQD